MASRVRSREFLYIVAQSSRYLPSEVAAHYVARMEHGDAKTTFTFDGRQPVSSGSLLCVGADSMLLGRRYRLVERIGVGGAASVFRARDTILDRDVALKALHTDLVDDELHVDRFEAEVDILRDLSHRRLTRFLSSGTDDDPVPWYAMELVDGRSLAHPEHRDAPARLLVSVAEQVCDALSYLHAQAIVHRDLKPQNIMVDAKGAATLIDLGIAQRVDMPMTIQGSILGTPHFMAPEQAIDPTEVDGRSDLYSLGVTLFSVMTRHSAMELGFERSRQAALELLPEAVRGAIARATEPEPARRFQSAYALRAALADARKAL